MHSEWNLFICRGFTVLHYLPEFAQFHVIELMMSSIHPFLCFPHLLLPSIFPSIRVFSVNQYFASGGQSIGASASALILPMDIQDWFPLGWTQESSPTPQFKSINSSGLSFLYRPTLTSKHDYWKTIALTRWTFVGKVMSLLLNMLSRLVIAFLPRSKCLNFMAAVTICTDFGAQVNKVCHCFHCFLLYLPWSDGTRCHNLSYPNVEI